MSETDRYRVLIVFAAVCAVVAAAFFSWACLIVFALGFACGGLHACIRMLEVTDERG